MSRRIQSWLMYSLVCVPLALLAWRPDKVAPLIQEASQYPRDVALLLIFAVLFAWPSIPFRTARLRATVALTILTIAVSIGLLYYITPHAWLFWVALMTPIVLYVGAALLWQLVPSVRSTPN